MDNFRAEVIRVFIVCAPFSPTSYHIRTFTIYNYTIIILLHYSSNILIHRITTLSHSILYYFLLSSHYILYPVFYITYPHFILFISQYIVSNTTYNITIITIICIIYYTNIIILFILLYIYIYNK